MSMVKYQTSMVQIVENFCSFRRIENEISVNVITTKEHFNLHVTKIAPEKKGKQGDLVVTLNENHQIIPI